MIVTSIKCISACSHLYLYVFPVGDSHARERGGLYPHQSASCNVIRCETLLQVVSKRLNEQEGPNIARTVYELPDRCRGNLQISAVDR